MPELELEQLYVRSSSECCPHLDIITPHTAGGKKLGGAWE